MKRREALGTTAALFATATAGCLGGDTLAPRATYLTLDTGQDLEVGKMAQDIPPKTTGVMETKLNQAVAIMTDPDRGEELHLRAIDQGMEAIYMSNLVPLPTAGVDEAGQFFDVFFDLEQQLEAGLRTHVETVGNDRTTAAALDALNFVQVATEAMQVVGAETAQCDPNNPEECEKIADTDMPGGMEIVDDRGRGGPPGREDRAGSHFVRRVRSPFFVGHGLTGRDDIPEKVITPGALARGDCAPVVKEAKGIVAIVRPIVVPIWVEPWFARARIVGFRTIWVWEFVPAEFIKTITYCNEGGEVSKDVHNQVVLERELMHFWRFFRQH